MVIDRTRALVGGCNYIRSKDLVVLLEETASFLCTEPFLGGHGALTPSARPNEDGQSMDSRLSFI